MNSYLYFKKVFKRHLRNFYQYIETKKQKFQRVKTYLQNQLIGLGHNFVGAFEQHLMFLISKSNVLFFLNNYIKASIG